MKVVIEVTMEMGDRGFVDYLNLCSQARVCHNFGAALHKGCVLVGSEKVTKMRVVEVTMEASDEVDV